VIRTFLILFLLLVVAIAAFAVAGEPGRASLEWLGWRLDMTAVSAALVVLVGSLALVIFWRMVVWIAEAPRRNARRMLETRRRQAGEALSRGFLAAAAGDGSEARRLAQKAADLVDDHPALVRVLTAQAAEAAGDHAAAKGAYAAMLGFPDMRLAGLHGLMETALTSGDRPAALRHAEEAYGLAKTARWAWRALLEDRLEAGDWAAALGLVKGALDRKIVSPIVADRARAALLAASAASLEGSADAKRRAQALDFASQSAKLKADFAPGVVIAARLLAAENKLSRASSLIESAWQGAPHPALWLTYRDLKTSETPAERAQRLGGLATLNPQPRESRILMVEQALIAGAPEAVREAAANLPPEDPTVRLCGLRARIAQALGQPDEARAWIARAGAAAQEAEWSDIDLKGRAFAYSPADWARLVSTYAETGELIHPRFERRERSLTELPDLPLAYASAPGFLQAAESGLAPIDAPDIPDPYAPELYPYEEIEASPPSQQPIAGDRRRAGARRRLAPAPRTAK